MLEQNSNIFYQDKVDDLNLYGLIWPFTHEQIIDEELLVLLLEFFILCLLRTHSDSNNFFLNNSQTFQFLSSKSVQYYLHQNKNSLLFQKSVFYIGNYLCKGINIEEMFDLLSLMENAFTWLKFEQYFNVYSALIWLLRIIFVYLGSSSLPNFMNRIGTQYDLINSKNLFPIQSVLIKSTQTSYKECMIRNIISF
jgi:hypothetical protein